MKTTNHINLLGFKAKDAVTGFKGVITSLSFDLYGCIQVVITPPVDDKGEVIGGQWFDISRIITSGKNPVMAVPNFSDGAIARGEKGCSNKPLP